MQARKENSNKQADGFLNLSLVDANGNRHNFKTGIPLHKDRKIDKLLLNDPSIVEKFTIENVVLTVNPLTEAIDPVF